MPVPVVYIRGFQPSLIDAASVDTAMLADLKSVATLSDESVTALRERLSAVKGFLDPKTLGAAVRGVIDNGSLALSVLNALQNLTPGDAKPLVEALAKRQAKDEGFSLDANELERLRKILPELIQPYPALTRFEKAERLAKLTGQELESIDLICDLRPVFDEDRKQIECMMPYTRLRIVATGVDGLPKSFEAELTHQQVFDLRKKAEKAESKLGVLRDSVERWSPEGLPDLPLTRLPRKESDHA